MDDDNTIAKMFEEASRLKIRFNHKGLISHEDIWDLDFDSRDCIFKELNSKKKAISVEGLRGPKWNEDKILDLKLAIIKHIDSVLLAEETERKNESQRSAKKQKIMAIMSTKQDAELHDLPVGELQKLLDEI